MMKAIATRSSPEPQRSAFSDNSSVTECSRCEHFSPCSCCCRLVTERLDAGPSRCSLNDQSGPQFQRAASTTSPNPNVQPSAPTPATSNAADVSTSLRALAAVSTCDQPMEIAHPNTSTIPVTQCCHFSSDLGSIRLRTTNQYPAAVEISTPESAKQRLQ